MLSLVTPIYLFIPYHPMFLASFSVPLTSFCMHLVSLVTLEKQNSFPFHLGPHSVLLDTIVPCCPKRKKKKRKLFFFFHLVPLLWLWSLNVLLDGLASPFHHSCCSLSLFPSFYHCSHCIIIIPMAPHSHFLLFFIISHHSSSSIPIIMSLFLVFVILNTILMGFFDQT